MIIRGKRVCTALLTEVIQESERKTHAQDKLRGAEQEQTPSQPAK